MDGWVIKILIDSYLEDSVLGDVGAVQSLFINTLMLFVVGMVRIQLLLVRTASSRTADLLFSSHCCYYTYRLMDWGGGGGSRGGCHQVCSSSTCLDLQTPAPLKSHQQKIFTHQLMRPLKHVLSSFLLFTFFISARFKSKTYFTPPDCFYPFPSSFFPPTLAPTHLSRPMVCVCVVTVEARLPLITVCWGLEGMCSNVFRLVLCWYPPMMLHRNTTPRLECYHTANDMQSTRWNQKRPNVTSGGSLFEQRFFFFFGLF